MIYPEGSVVKDSEGRIGKVVGYHKNLNQYEINFFMPPDEIEFVTMEEPEEAGPYGIRTVSGTVTYLKREGGCWFFFGEEKPYRWPPLEGIVECRKLD